MLLRFFFLAGMIFTASLSAQTDAAGGGLNGRVERDVYFSPTKAFSIRIPVLPQLGGQVRDNENIVTFQDAFTTHVSIATFPLDANQRRELGNRGPGDYFAYFFNTYVLPDFVRAYPDTQIESMEPTSSIEGGALMIYVLMPGGSMFAGRASRGLDGSMAAAKRGNLVFIKNDFVYVISMELAERVLEGTSYKLKKPEEDRLLKQRLEAILDRIQFAPAEARPQ